jgi:hypothetical protein
MGLSRHGGEGPIQYVLRRSLPPCVVASDSCWRYAPLDHSQSKDCPAVSTSVDRFDGLWLWVGVFNLAEGIIDHHILGIHHTVESASEPVRLYWDLAFLLFGGALLVTIGSVYVYKAQLHFNEKL